MKKIDTIIDKLQSNNINGSKLLSLLQTIPSAEMIAMGIDKLTQSKIRTKIRTICRNLDNMDDIETMYWIHSMPIAQISLISQTLLELHIDGAILLKNHQNLKSFLQSHLAQIDERSIDALTHSILQTINENGGYVPNYLIQDPHILNAHANSIQLSESDQLELAQKKKQKKL